MTRIEIGIITYNPYGLGSPRNVLEASSNHTGETVSLPSVHASPGEGASDPHRMYVCRSRGYINVSCGDCQMLILPRSAARAASKQREQRTFRHQNLARNYIFKVIL